LNCWRQRALALLGAIALDLALGEPPNRFHPVVWMGRAVGRLEKMAPPNGNARQLAYGAACELLCLAAAAGVAGLLERLAFRFPAPLGIAIGAVLLKPAFSIRALFSSFERVGRALGDGDLGAARHQLSRIVSREVAQLDEGQVAAAAVESLAENASDSVVAPALAFALLGLPGAYGYRMANTLDAMWGYRGRYEQLGKAAARVDDLLNLVPARLAALLVAAGSGLAQGSPRDALAAAWRDAGLVASPNAGWPMAAAAGGLDIRLEKVDHYVLNPDGRLPGAEQIGRAQTAVAGGLALFLASMTLVLWRWRRGC